MKKRQRRCLKPNSKTYNTVIRTVKECKPMIPMHRLALDMDDLIQEGLLAAHRAMKTYDPDKGVKWRTYLIQCIKNAMVSIARRGYTDMRNAPTYPIEEFENRLTNEAVGSCVKAEDIHQIIGSLRGVELKVAKRLLRHNGKWDKATQGIPSRRRSLIRRKLKKQFAELLRVA